MMQPILILRNFYLIALFTLTSMQACKRGGPLSGNDNSHLRIDSTITFLRIDNADTILPGWSRENVVVNHIPGPPDNLHPTNGRLAARSWIFTFTQKYLMRLDPMLMEVVPDLAAAPPVIADNGLEYTYTIRKEARWDDGSPVTAADVAYSLKMAKCPLTNNPTTKSYLTNLADVRLDAANPLVCTMVMKEKYVQNISFLTSFIILQKSYHDPEGVMDAVAFQALEVPDFESKAGAAVVAYIADFNDGKWGNDIDLLNGAGPYKVTSWERGASLVLEKKQQHWSYGLTGLSPQEQAFPDKIIFKEVKDDNATILELKAEEIDASVWLSTQSMQTLEQDPNFITNYNYRYIDNFSFNYLGVNMRPDGLTHELFFNEKKVRHAMTKLIPIEQIVRVIYNDKADRWASFHAPAKPGYNDTLAPYASDINGAIALLEEAGWVDSDGDNIRDKVINGRKVPFSFELMYSSSGAFIDQMVEMIKESCYQAGIEMRLAPMELPVLSQKVGTHDFDAYLGAWATNSLPDDFTQLWHTSSYAEGSNYCGFGNAVSDSLIDLLRTTVEPQKRIPMIKELQAIVYEEAPYVMLFSANRKNVIHKRFGNQIMTFERPGNILNYLLLLQGEGMQEIQ